MSAVTATPPSTTGPSTPESANSQSKKYSLVKWLENSQFDAQNEWLGRLTSVQHSNIIDFDADELKPGMEISVFRNGEIWRAQVIIPKTASNTIDLPPSSHKVSKIRTKAMGTTTTLAKLNDSLEMMDTGSGSIDDNKTFIDLNELCASSSANPSSNDDLGNTLMILTSAPTTASSNQANTGANNAVVSSTPILNRNKELQFLQTAISEAGISDFYQAYNNSNNNSNASLNTTLNVSGAGNGAQDQPQILLKSSNNFVTITSSGMVQQPSQIPTHLVNNVIAVSDSNIEAILQMQNEFLEHQKELKTIEGETMEQLRLLHQNIGRLAKKFDSFEAVIASLNSLSQNGSQAQANGLSSNIKSAKTTLNKINSSIQQIRLEDLGGALLSPSSSATASTAAAALATIPQALSNLQLIINPATNTVTTFTSASNQIQTLTPIQLDNITNTSNKTIKQLTESNNFTKTTTILLASPIQLQQISSGANTQPSVTATLVPTSINSIATASAGTLHKESNEIVSNTSSSNNENNVEMKLVDSKENTNSSSNNKLQAIQTQIQLNKFLRETVKQKLGVDFLITHAVSDIPVDMMNEIKKEAFDKYLPNDRRPMKAWGLAMASLRCLRRDLSKNKNKQQLLANKDTKPSQISTVTTNSLISTIATRRATATAAGSNLSTVTAKTILTANRRNSCTNGSISPSVIANSISSK